MTGIKYTAAQKMLLEKEHDSAEEKRMGSHQHCKDLLKKIADEEVTNIAGRGIKRTLEQVNGNIDENEEQRKKVKSQRIEDSRQLAKRQERKEELLHDLLRSSIDVLQRTNDLIAKLSGDMYPTQPLTRTNNNIDSEESNQM